MEKKKITDLLEMLSSPDANVRRAAAMALGDVRTDLEEFTLLLDAIEDALQDKDASVREAFLKSIENIEFPRAVVLSGGNILSTALMSPEDWKYLANLRAMLKPAYSGIDVTPINLSSTIALNPRLLRDEILPLVEAIQEIQEIINEITGKKIRTRIVSISQRSPITLNLDGAADALQVLREAIIPWRRKHAQTIALLLEQERQLEIEKKRVEILEARLRTAKERAEQDKLALEREKQKAEIERLHLENEKMKVELQRSKVELALEILNKISPHLSEVDRIAYLVKLLSPIEKLLTINTEITL
ncbi:MAG: HEAT repeat domain-containing protein [Candidatus Caldarchaeum sp.]